ncbi:teichuronic acid biosynthesis glycosyltransferase TuaG [Bacillus pumilus]|uniref:teichuronic acid biosynthesis protein TuaG n=1 Tax=Bacillus pumilus TaxID=1408 RepID=UPI00278285E1|nr:glycosyltransferase family 2 protein [Bacillus pumilus]MDQ0818587.1 teichuronic acid biosynthesis glycosyltransferase TuaG [Bacillus pumilus]
MNNQPLVSIITPAYNAERYLTDTVHSVLAQTYSNWELIIADDCSTDGTRKLLGDLSQADDRINVIYLEENGGAAIARNAAINQAKGRFIAFLDSDDKWKETKLEKQVDFMLKNDYAFTFTAYDIIAENGEPLEKTVTAPARLDYNEALKNTIIGCLTVMLDLQKVGHVVMPNIRTRQDLATWLSILKRGFTAYGMSEPLSEYRIVGNSISSNKWKAAKKTWFVYREIEQLHFVKASWCFMHYATNAVKKRL